MESKEENGQHNFSGDIVSSVIDDARRPFDVICDDLAALGALSAEDFLNNATSSSAVFDINFHLQLPDIPIPEKDKDKPAKTDDTEESKSATAANAKMTRNTVTLLRQTCETVLGSFEALRYEYLERDPKNRQCILTITRPGGGTRAYKSEAGPLRKGEAKAQAAQIAVDMGAIDFIMSGDSDALKAKQGLLLNPLDAETEEMELDECTTPPPRPPAPVVDITGPLKEIEDCCLEWRAGKVKPHWVFYNDTKNKKKHGAALRIALIAHVFRAYSVDPIYDTPTAAKIACAKVALEQGVKNFIQYGNGQTEPLKIVDDGSEELMTISRGSPAPVKGLTLQEFYDSLPQPFPEDVGNAAAADINGAAWLNLTLQSARGARLVSNFVPIVDTENKLHGCLLRIERPDEIRTYLADPQFPKRSDARAAVCLLAMSQGVGNYIRRLKEESDNKLPAYKRKLANEKLLQLLAADCSKVRQGNRLIFLFAQERDAFGCTLKVDISPNSINPDVREYVAKTEYRTKADAKAAVACIAAEQGLVDLLRFKGAPLPSDYVPFWEAQLNGDGDNYIPKRKEPERETFDGESRDRKKRKKGNKDNTSTDNLEIIPPPPLREAMKIKAAPEDHPLPPKPASLPPTPVNPSGNARWKAPHVTGSRGLGPTNAHASAPRSVGQDRSGNRSGGPPTHPRSYHAMSSFSEVSSYSKHERSPHDYSYDDRVDYRHDPSYRPPPPPDPYGGSYPRYPPPPPPVQSHYSSSGYIPSPPPPPHHYPAYYSAPPTPPHDPYRHGHYVYASPYPPPPPQPYPAPYPVSYSSHPAVIYSPHPPPMAMMPPSPPGMVPSDPYHPRYRSSYPTRSPSPPYTPPAMSPPRHSHHSHHASDYISPESSRHGVNNHRRHSTIGDSSRSRSNGYRPRLVEDERGWYNDRDPSPPPLPPSRRHRRDHDHDRPRSRSRSRADYRSERSNSEHGTQRTRTPEIVPPPVSPMVPDVEVSKPPVVEVPKPPAVEVLQPEPEVVISKVVVPDSVVKVETIPETLKPAPAPAIAAVKPEVKEPPANLTTTVKHERQIEGPHSRIMTNLEVLNEFCEKKNIVKPTFYHQVVHEEDGSKAYIVWAEKDSQRMALKNHFKTIEEGHQKLSKSVLQYERSKLARK